MDVYGTDRPNGKFVGVQGKGKNKGYGGALKEKELRDEVAKARTFTPKLDRFILVTTAPGDVVIQKVAREINESHKKEGLFEVDVFAWDEIKHVLQHHPAIIHLYYSGSQPTLHPIIRDAIEAGGQKPETSFSAF